MHVMRHLPISGLSLPLPPKIQQNIIIVKGPAQSFNNEVPQMSEKCPPKINSPVQTHNTAPAESHSVNSVKLHCCSICMKGFCEEKEWMAHVVRHSKPESLICRVCGKGYIKESDFQTHLRRHNPRKPYACNRCMKSFTQSKLLSRHLLTHPGIKPFRCTLCTRSFLYRESLESHLDLHASMGVFCHICEERFSNELEFEVHCCGYSGKKPNICEVCDRPFFCSRSYNSHIEAHGKGDLSLVRS